MTKFFLVCVAILGYNSAPQSGRGQNWGAKLEPIYSMDSNLENTVTDSQVEYKLSDERTEIFWSRVEIKGPDECWPWKRGVDRDGYGRFEAFGGSRCTHQIALFLHTGKHWGKLSTLHKCDNPICCNPEHLFLGTSAENNTDRHRKGRDAKGESHGSRNHLEKWKRGENHHASVLNEDKVREARRMKSDDGLTCKQIAEKLGVSQSLIAQVVRRTAWKHVI